MFDFAIKYLSHYGYLASGVSSGSIDDNTQEAMVAQAVMEFQKAAGLPATGSIDEATELKMSQPRCGLMDVRRETFELSRWRKTNLTYFIEKRVNGLSAGDVDDIITLAWRDWMNIADFKITPTLDRNADIVISTGSGRADGFDGPSGTLAYAYLPNGTDGQLLMRFDLSETWLKDNPQGGILLRNVACHEFGHLLGLEHSRVSSALMAPFYSPSVVSPRASDDIPRIVALYGAAKTPPPTPGPLPSPMVVRLSKQLAAGTYGDFALGSLMDAGDYVMVPIGDQPPPPVP